MPMNFLNPVKILNALNLTGSINNVSTGVTLTGTPSAGTPVLTVQPSTSSRSLLLYVDDSNNKVSARAGAGAALSLGSTTDMLNFSSDGLTATVGCNMVLSKLTSGGIVVTDSTGKLVLNPNLNQTSLGYVDITSSLQSQLTSLQTAIAGKQSTLTGLATGSVLTTDSTGKIVSSISATTLNYLDVTSSVQNSLNSITASIATKQTTISGLTASTVLQTDATGKIVSSSVAAAQLGYLANVTSDIQQQLNAVTGNFTGAVTSITTTNLPSSRVLISDANGKVSNSSVTSTTLSYLDINSSLNALLAAKQQAISGLTGSAVLVTDSSSNIVSSTVPVSKLGYLTNVTSDIQNQLNSISSQISNNQSAISGLSASSVLVTDATGKIVSSPVTTTQLGYLSNVTGDIQAQLTTLSNNAVPTQTASRVLVSDVNGKVASSTVTSATLGYLDIGSSLTGLLAAKQAAITGLTNSTILVVNASGGIVSSTTPSVQLTYLNNVTSDIQTQLTTLSNNAVPTQTASRVLVSDVNGKVASSTVTSATLGYLDIGSSLTGLLAAKQATITGAATTVTSSNLTAGMALVSDGNGKIGTSSVTATTLGYLDATSSIQTQLNAKQSTITGAATTVTSTNLAASVVLVSDGSGKIGASSVTSTALGYLDATSSIQTQLNAKQATLIGATTTVTSSNLTAARVVISDANGKIAAASVTSTTLGYLDATSSIQTQLNGKQAAITGLTANTVLKTDGSGNIASSALSSTILPYLSTIRSDIQVQVDAMQPAITVTPSSVLVSDTNGKVSASAVTSTTLSYLDVGSSLTALLVAKAPIKWSNGGRMLGTSGIGNTYETSTTVNSVAAAVTGFQSITNQLATTTLVFNNDAVSKQYADSTRRTLGMPLENGMVWIPPADATNTGTGHVDQNFTFAIGSDNILASTDFTATYAIAFDTAANWFTSNNSATQRFVLILRWIATSTAPWTYTVKNGAGSTVYTSQVYTGQQYYESRCYFSATGGANAANGYPMVFQVSAAATTSSTVSLSGSGILHDNTTPWPLLLPNFTTRTLSLGNLTAGAYALVTDSTGGIVSSTVTAAQVGYLSNVTSDIQTQLNATQPLITGAASTVTTSNLTAYRVVTTDANGKLTSTANASSAPTVGNSLNVVSSGTLPFIQLGSSATQTTGYASLYLNPSLSNNYAASIRATRPSSSTYGGDLSFWLQSTSSDSSPIEKVRFMSTGNVGIGTSAPTSLLDLYNATASSNAPYLTIRGNGGTGNQVGININPTSTRTGGTPITITGIEDGNGAANLAFSVAATGASGALTERMRIASTGFTGFGTTAPNYTLHVNPGTTAAAGGVYIGTQSTNLVSRAPEDAVLQVEGVSGARACQVLYHNTTSDNTFLRMRNSGGTLGTWSVSGGVFSYPSSSDRRLKENIRPLDPARALDIIRTVRPSTYNFIRNRDLGIEEDGFVAQEMYIDYKNAASYDASEDWWGVDSGKLIPVHIAATQQILQTQTEQQSAIEALQNTVQGQQAAIDALQAALQQLQQATQ